MNILFITNHLNVGGITSYVLTLSKGLHRNGHKVFVASCGGELLAEFKRQGIIFVPVPLNTKQEASPKIIISAWKLSRLVQQEKIDIVHAHSRTTQVVACLLRKITGIPYIFTCHGFFKPRFLRRMFPCWGNKIIAISAQVQEHLVNDFKVDPQMIRVVHNGIDLERFRLPYISSTLESRKKFGLGDGPVVGIVARLSVVKGHIFLIEAMSEVLKDLPEAKLFLVGEGRIQEDLEMFIRRLKIEKSVVFLPSIQDTREALSVMDVFVMPSLEEGLGLGLMEAMAQGLAVVGSDVGGIKSLIQHEHSGLLVEPKNVSALAQAMSVLLRDKKKRSLLGANARDFILQNFSSEKMVEETQKVYLECLN